MYPVGSTSSTRYCSTSGMSIQCRVYSSMWYWSTVQGTTYKCKYRMQQSRIIVVEEVTLQSSECANSECEMELENLNFVNDCFCCMHMNANNGLANSLILATVYALHLPSLISLRSTSLQALIVPRTYSTALQHFSLQYKQNPTSTTTITIILSTKIFPTLLPVHDTIR